MHDSGVLILVMLLSLVPAFAEIPTLAAETSPTAVITIAGMTVPIRLGEVVARGTKTSEALCTGLDCTIRIDAPKRFGYVGVVLQGSPTACGQSRTSFSTWCPATNTGGQWLPVRSSQSLAGSCSDGSGSRRLRTPFGRSGESMSFMNRSRLKRLPCIRSFRTTRALLFPSTVLKQSASTVRCRASAG